MCEHPEDVPTGEDEVLLSELLTVTLVILTI